MENKRQCCEAWADYTPPGEEELAPERQKKHNLLTKDESLSVSLCAPMPSSQCCEIIIGWLIYWVCSD